MSVVQVITLDPYISVSVAQFDPADPDPAANGIYTVDVMVNQSHTAQLAMTPSAMPMESS